MNVVADCLAGGEQPMVAVARALSGGVRPLLTPLDFRKQTLWL